MELRQLRHFVAAAEEGNISRAARRIFLTQPALSRQIRALEEELGFSLLERLPHSIRLTPAGQSFLDDARELLLHADQVLERARGGAHSRRLRIGFAPSLASAFLSIAVEQFTHRHPGVRIELLDLSTAEMIQGLEEGHIELALGPKPGRASRDLRWTPLVTSRWKLAVPVSHPLARSVRVEPQALAGVPILIYCRREYPEYAENVLGWFRSHRLLPHIAGEYNGADSLFAAIEGGLGVALVTDRATRFLPERIRLLQLIHAPAPFQIAAGHRREPASPDLSAFIDILKTTSSTPSTTRTLPV